jgi:hypothetical protein
MKTTIVSIFCCTIIFASISSVESTWLLYQRCNGTTVEGWGTYLTGACFSIWGSTGYGTCSGSEYTTYNCRGSATCDPASCKTDTVTQMGVCGKDNNYQTCSSGDPDYSAFGSSYATMQVYADEGCSSSPLGIGVAVINKCHTNPGSSPSDDYQSVYVACSKSGTATLNIYKDADCQQLIRTSTANTNTCTSDNTIYMLPFIATCHGF